MKKKIKFILLTVWIIFSRCYDIYATSQFTPDLKREANPLVSVLGFGWSPLIIIIGILTIYTVYAFYISTFKQFNLFPLEKGFNFGEFITYIYLGKKKHWSSLLYKFPNKISRLNHYMGYLLPMAFVLAGIITTLMWILINHADFYYKNYHSGGLIYSIVIIGTTLIWLDWNIRLFKKYKTVYNKV